MTQLTQWVVNGLQLCEQEDIPLEYLHEIVAHGIVHPGGGSPEEWRFDARMVRVVRRAGHLYRDLEVDWGGIALALDLLQQLEELRAENRRLRRQLSRFLVD